MKKTIMVHLDGVPADSSEELDGRTVLQAANIPHLDALASHGELGRLGVPNEARPFVGELAFLALLGYDTQKWYAGPGAFEAMNLEVVLDRNDVAFLCDFVTLRAEDGWGDGKKLGSSLVMDDISGGGLETEEAREFIDAINEQLVSENIQFYMGHHARHLMVWVGGNAKIGCRSPQEALGEPIDRFLATGEGASILSELMEASRMILRHHPVNQERVKAGLKPVNCLWPWGQGKPVELTPLKERWSIEGAVISQSGPYRGIAMASGLPTVTVEEGDDNEPDRLRKMAALTSKILEKRDLACLHVPFSRVVSNPGSTSSYTMSVDYLQQIDEHLIASLQQTCAEMREVRLFVVVTPCANTPKQNVHSAAQYVVFEGNRTDGEPLKQMFHESACANSLHNAPTFFERFFRKQ